MRYHCNVTDGLYNTWIKLESRVLRCLVPHPPNPPNPTGGLIELCLGVNTIIKSASKIHSHFYLFIHSFSFNKHKDTCVSKPLHPLTHRTVLQQYVISLTRSLIYDLFISNIEASLSTNVFLDLSD